MRMDLTISRRVLKNGLVLATTLITCTAMQANEQSSSDKSKDSSAAQIENSGGPQSSERATGAGALGGENRSATANKQQQEKFVQKALKGGQMEVQLGQMAQQNGQNQQVKNLGQALVRDHTMANQQLQQIAQSLNITVAGQHQQQDPLGKQNRPGQQAQGGQQGLAHGHDADKHAKAQQEMEKLKGQTGAEFDKEFVRMAIKHHKKDIKEFEQAQQQLQNPELKSFVQQTLPKLRQHLQMAQAAARTVGVDESTLSSDDSDATGIGAPAAGQQGSDLKPRSSIQDDDASLSGEAQIGDREFSTDVDADIDRTDNAASLDIDAETEDGKVFQKGDGKILGLPTSKTDGKFLGIIPAPGADNDEDADLSIEADADTDTAVGGAARSESGTATDPEVEVDIDTERK